MSIVAPNGTTDKTVNAYVKKKANWIVQKLFLFKYMEFRKINREMVNGESLLYLGWNYTLQVIDNSSLKKPIVSLFQGQFHIKTPTRDEKALQKAMIEWYKQKAEQRIVERTNYYQHYFKRKTTSIKVKNYKNAVEAVHLIMNYFSIGAASWHRHIFLTTSSSTKCAIFIIWTNPKSSGICYPLNCQTMSKEKRSEVGFIMLTK